MSTTFWLIGSFGLSGVLLGVIGWILYQWMKEKAGVAMEEEMQQTIAKERRKIEDAYKARPDDLDESLDRL